MENGTQAKALSSLTATELFELVFHLRQCNESAPEETRRMLQEQPEFARAIAQALLKMGMLKDQQSMPNLVGPSVATELMEKLDPEQQELLEQVSNLAPEVIQSLPPDERRQIMELREAMGLPPV